MLGETDFAWAAAVFDLKAHVIKKNNQDRATDQLVLMVESKNLSVIRRLTEMCGLTVPPSATRKEPKDFMRRGCADHCPSAHVHTETDWNMPPTSRWTVTGISLAIVLYTTLPYMHGDTAEFESALSRSITNAVLSGQGSGQVMSAIRRLLGMGWRIPPTLLGELAVIAVGPQAELVAGSV